MRVDVGDYVHGVLLRQALRGKRDLEVDILRCDSGQSQGHQCVEEVVTIHYKKIHFRDDTCLSQ